MRVRVKKMFGGKVSVRSYLVKYCKRNKQNLIIEFEGKKMTIEYFDLNKYTTDNNVYVTKRFDKYIGIGEKYKLYDYIWRPDPEEVSWTKEGATKISEAWHKFKNSI